MVITNQLLAGMILQVAGGWDYTIQLYREYHKPL